MNRLAELLSEYGAAKFGDKWWPKSACLWIGEEKGTELDALLEAGDHPTPKLNALMSEKNYPFYLNSLGHATEAERLLHQVASMTDQVRFTEAARQLTAEAQVHALLAIARKP